MNAARPQRKAYGEIRWCGRLQPNGRTAYDVLTSGSIEILATVAADPNGGWDAYVHGEHIGHARLKVDAQYIAEAILDGDA
jgi:hypothetical protein